MQTELDHIVVGCADLASGEAWMEDLLGKPAQGGGEHVAMSTHNKVWSLGSCFLELIAINPAAPDPGRKRWFSLDDPAIQKKLAMGPHLLTWAVRVDDIHAAQALSPISLGALHELERGDLKWKVLIPEDGGLLQDGHVPLVIQWLTPHPAERMEDSGMRLKSLTASRDEPTLVENALKEIGAAELITVQNSALTTSLMAEVSTEEGNVSFVG
jgi:hypothetical protein